MYTKSIFYLLVVQSIILYSQEQPVRAARQTESLISSCAGCAEDACCNLILEDLEIIHSQIDELIDCACCQYLITQADIDAGNFTISSPGIYVVCSDLMYFGGSGRAIYIDNSIGGDIVVDFKQHSLTGPGYDIAVQISGSAGSVLVQNGVFSGFDYGLTIDANNVSVKNITLFDFNQAGIFAQTSDTLMITNTSIKGTGAYGIQLSDVANLFLSDIKIDGVGLGIAIDGLNTASVKKVQVYRSSNYGLFLTGNSAQLSDIIFAQCEFDLCQNGIAIEQTTVAGETIKNIAFFDTVVSGAFNTGVYLYAVNNTTFKPILFKDCQFLGSGVDGCWVENGQGHVFENCQALNCARFGFYLHNGSAHVLKNCTLTFNGFNPGGATEVGSLFVYLCERCQVYDSVISSNAEDAVYLKDANRFVIQNSSLCNNGKGGVFMAQTTGVENARIIACTICSNAQTGVYCANSNTLVERCTISENLHGINVISTSIDCQILNNWVANNVSRGIINDNASSYIWGNSSAKNAINFGGSFQPPNIAPTSTSPYWANIRV